MKRRKKNYGKWLNQMQWLLENEAKLEGVGRLKGIFWRECFDLGQSPEEVLDLYYKRRMAEIR